MIIPNFYKTILTIEDTEINLQSETNINITCKLIDYNNNPVIGEEVTIKIDGTEIATKKTNSNGLIIFTYDCSNLDEGYYIITANEAHISFRVLYVGDWIPLTLASGYATYNQSDTTDNVLKYRRVHNIVEVRGIIRNTSAISANTNYKTVATLPTGFRPNSVIENQNQGSGENRVEWRIDTDGVLAWRYYGTTTNIQMPVTAWLNIHFIFSI